MSRRSWSSSLVLAWALASLVGCGKTEGTFVHLEFVGLPKGTPIQSIKVDFQFDSGPSATAVFQPSTATRIELPTTASLKIRNGDGGFAVLATAWDGRDGKGSLLGSGRGTGTVVRNQTTDKLSISLGAPAPAGGLDAGIDGVTVAVDTGIDGAWTDGPHPIDGSSAASTDADQALPDAPAVDAPVLGGASGAGGATGAGGAGGAGGSIAVPSDDGGPTEGSGGVSGGGDIDGSALVDANVLTGGSPGSGGASDAGGSPGSGGVVGSGGSLGTGGLVGAGGGLDTGGTLGTGGDPGSGGSAPTYRLTATPPSRDFGIVAPGSASQALTFTILNDGEAAAPSLVLGNNAPQVFVTDQDGCAGKTLAPSESCTVSFTFRPAVAGTIEATGAVGPSGGTVATFSMTGAGSSAAPELAVVPSTLDFKIVDVSTPSSLDLTVRNIGSADAGNLSAALGGSGPFTISSNACAGASLAAGAQCLITIAFTPTAPGAASNTVTIQSTSGLSAGAALTGTGRDYIDLSIGFSGDGSGKVIGTDINCPSSGGTCNVKVPRTGAVATLTLTATGLTYSSFTAWSGACSGKERCSLSMDSATTVTANFVHQNYTLSVVKAGTGTGKVTSGAGEIDCGSKCSSLISAGGTVTLTATPDPGSSLTSWSGGGCSGNAATCTVVMAAVSTVTATFAPAQYTLQVTKRPVGTVKSDIGGIDCGATCSASFVHGTQVVLSAEPGVGYAFAGWSGGGCSDTGYCILTMTAATTVNAIFVQPLTCDYDNMKCGSNTLELNLGNIGAVECPRQCAIQLPAADVSKGCWVWTGTTCYCRNGTPTGSGIGGGCHTP